MVGDELERWHPKRKKSRTYLQNLLVCLTTLSRSVWLTFLVFPGRRLNFILEHQNRLPLSRGSHTWEAHCVGGTTLDYETHKDKRFWTDTRFSSVCHVKFYADLACTTTLRNCPVMWSRHVSFINKAKEYCKQACQPYWAQVKRPLSETFRDLTGMSDRHCT